MFIRLSTNINREPHTRCSGQRVDQAVMGLAFQHLVDSPQESEGGFQRH